MKAIREQRKHDKHMKLSEKYEGDNTDCDEILSVTTVNNEEVKEDYDDTESEISETDSYCRHCVRPQSELQLKYMRPRQRSKLRQQQQGKRDRSKQRFTSYYTGSGSGNANTSAAATNGPAQKMRSKKSRSKSRAKRARNNKHATGSNKTNNKEQHLKLPLIRDLNAANEQAIRFRCPQVGPQVGRDRQMPPLLHFHHPQHVQKQLTTTAAYQVQYTHVYGQQQSQRFAGPQAISPMQTTTLTMESELKQQHLHQQHHHHHHHVHHQHNEHLSNNQKSNRNQQQSHTPTTPTKDLTATKTTAAVTTTTTVAGVNNSPNCCCFSIHQQNQQQYSSQCPGPQCSRDCKQQLTSLSATTPCCCCCCASMASTSATTTQFHHHYHHFPPHHHHQHHNLPQLPLTHLETTSTTAVASLDATTLVVTANTTTTAATSIPSLAPLPSTTAPPFQVSAEYRSLNLNNPTTTTTTAAADEENPSNLAVATTTATTPDSPSLVKVSTWYTVAKQGVSC